jgi:undecaprenyl-diphosphatase
MRLQLDARTLWRNPTFRLLLAMLSVGLLVYGFIRIADEVVEGDTQDFDHAVVNFFRSPLDPTDIIGPSWVEEMARDLTAMGSFIVLGILVALVVFYLLAKGKRGAALLTLVSVLGGSAISLVLKSGFNRPRPDLSPVAEVFTSSFPSGHAMVSTVVYLTLAAILSRLSSDRSLDRFFMGSAIVLTLLIGLTRIYLGVHYPTDVLAGWCLGAAWALLCFLVASILQRRGKVEAPEETP